MTRYKVQWVDKAGSNGVEIIFAADRADVYQQFKAKGATVVSIKEAANTSLFSKKIGKKDIELFITNLASLISSGISLDRALSLVARSTQSELLKQIVQEIHHKVRSGEEFSKALQAFPEFDEFSISLIRIGEATGTLGEVLQRVSEQLKFENQVKRTIQQAMIYPMVIVFVCVLSVVFILTTVVPQLEPMLETLTDLPGYTQALLAVSQWMRSPVGWVSGSLGVLVLVAFFMSTHTQVVATRQAMLRRIYAFPFISGFVKAAQELRFSAAMHATLASGLLLTKALELSARAVADASFGARIGVVKDNVTAGQPLAASLDESNVLQKLDIGFVEVGEETGDLAHTFEQIRKRKDEEFHSAISTLLKMLEPLLILFMGVVVGGVIIVMMLSIMNAQDVSF